MPGLARKLLIFAAVDGLVLQPISRRDQNPSKAIKIEYGSPSVSSRFKEAQIEANKSQTLEVYGIIGLINTSAAAYLISISQRQEVAQLWGKSIYVVKGVTIIPLASRSDAEKAITKALDASRDRDFVEDVDIPALTDIHGWHDDAEADGSLAVDVDSPQSDSEEKFVEPLQRKRSASRESSSIVQDVIHKKGLYGRFAEQWFSRGGWSNRQRETPMDHSNDIDRPLSPVVAPATLAPGLSSLKGIGCTPMDPTQKKVFQAADGNDEDHIEKKDTGKDVSNMLPKILSTTRLLFGSKTFFFSYDFDITRNLATQSVATSNIPLHKQVEPEYFWNRSLMSAFVAEGLDTFVLPVMQGFIGQKHFEMETQLSDTHNHTAGDSVVPNATSDAPSDIGKNATQDLEAKSDSTMKEFALTLISRRSVRRAGLRYLRRGIDEDGYTANSVETEQILSPSSWNASDTAYSFIQIRGSIPLFYSQSSYSFKPVPVMHGPSELNQKAFKKHFLTIAAKYGRVHAVSLLDTHGIEVKLGKAYEENAKYLNDNGGVNGKEINFEWFDFHGVCKGMRFENVGQLVEHQKNFLSASGWIEKKDFKTVSSQNGIIRTNCMDCLDRTNVVQSAFARYILEHQLEQQGIHVNLDKDSSTTWFNILWADNGDAISRAYAGTSALKGDYTRTRKRNIGGALNDLSLTLSRYYNNIFNDFFGQACIDYLLGNVTESVFTEFETTMMSADTAMDLDKLRQHAIDTCVKVVVEDHEDLICGWAMSCPQIPNTVKTLPFEECLLLLTELATYVCRFDWNTEKVQSFERVPLGQITSVSWGTYITSTLGPQHVDEKLNVGLVVRYKPEGKALVRVNTRSLQSEELTTQNDAKGNDDRILAFKALPNRSSIVGSKLSEAQKQSETALVQHICEELKRASMASLPNGEAGHEIEIEERPIISLEEARKNTGYLEQIGYSLKKLVWG